jgi:transcriptional regulator GlxA family with amidase domain
MSSYSPVVFEFLLFNGFSNMVLASALEPLRDVKIRSAQGNVDWVISTLDGAPVRSSSGIQIAPDKPFNAQAKARTLVLISGYQVRDQINEALKAQLRLAARQAARVVALDTGAWLLASAGLLDGHTATLHWQELDAFEETFPRVQVSHARFVRSGLFITCGGASAALDMTLDLIKSLFGSAAAFDASTMFVFDPEHQDDSQRAAKGLRDGGSPKVLGAINAMAENIETPLTTFQLADRVKLSERTLNRMFMRELGITPGRYYKLLRLQRARYLAEETHLSAEQIALRCGFSSATALGRSFTAQFGVSIKSFRTPQRL